VKEANDIVDVVGEYLTLTKRGRTFKGLCPFHDDHHPSLDVDPDRQYFRCWACGKHGDVFTFIMEKERCDFRSALELLAQRANLDILPFGGKRSGLTKADLFKVLGWAEECFHRQLFADTSQAARDYLDQRGLSRETWQTYRLGYAPDQWEWLTGRCRMAQVNLAAAELLGLVGRRDSDGSFYDRFRDRIIFPIRDGRGRTVAFGGRVIPGTATAEKGPKYYNSAESPLFTKSQHFYGLDRARPAAEKEGYLAVVEGYTDVLMAHQSGVMPVVATLGTALNEQHLSQLRRYVPRVVLVFDADAGGRAGVDRALTLFLQHEVDLALALLPEGQDPCDFLLSQGPDAFRHLLTTAPDALEWKVNQVLAATRSDAVESRRQAVDEVLAVLAQIPPRTTASLELKRQLAVTKLAQRFRLAEEVLWRRLAEQRRTGRAGAKESRLSRSTGRSPVTSNSPAAALTARGAERPKVDPLERQLVAVLLSAPDLIPLARRQLQPEDLENDGVREVVALLYRLAEEGQPVTMDQVRLALADRPRLAEAVERAFAEGSAQGGQEAWLTDLLARFVDRQRQRLRRDLRARLRTLPPDAPEAAALLAELQKTS
jgi:DNA primase